MASIKGFSYGVINSIVTALIGIVAIPIYLKYLGKEAYGIVAFFGTFQAILQIFDLGIAPTASREIAQLAKSENYFGTSQTIKTLERLGFVVLIFVSILVFFTSPTIASYWLKSTQLTVDQISNSIRLMSLIFGIRLISSVYSGARLETRNYLS